MTDLPDNLLRLASGRSVELVAQAAALRALAEVLKPGEVVSGRVVDQFASGDYLFALRGRTLVAASAVPLVLDTVVAFEVLPDDGRTPRLRLTTAAPGPAAAAAAPVPEDLGLPADAPARTVLDAFARAAAPLERAPVQAAWRAVAAAPPVEGAAIADAHAALARTRLPATPPLVALARTAADGPPPTAALLTRAADAAALVAARVPVAPAAAIATSTPAPIVAQAPASAPAPAAARVAPPPAAAPADATRPLADLVPRPPDAGTDGAAAVRTALTLVGLLIGSDRATSAAGDDGPAGSATDEDGASDRTPRAGSDDAPAGRAPAHPRAEPDPAARDRLLPRLAEAARALAGDSAPAAVAAHAAIVDAARAAAAETVVKPASLADYDLVLPLPLQAHGEATRARLAIARRTSANGVVATFLRVDVELSRLGSVSARLSGIAGGPLAVTIVAGPAARAVLAAGIEALESDLADRGASASVRLVDEAGDG